MNPNNKDTIYIDVDDEITTIIDKLRTSEAKIVALVLPKRASVLQSIVNMKLLKRSADNEQKRVVLITGEAGLLPLAGSVGLHVAKSLQSKPVIPGAPLPVNDDDDADAVSLLDGEPSEVTKTTDGTRPVGELAAPAAATRLIDDSVETLELGDDEAGEAAEMPPTPAAKPKKTKSKKDKKLAVPNFDRFRKILIIGSVVIVLLIAGFVWAATALPKATITIKTDTSTVNSSLTFTASKTAKSLTTSGSLVVPAQVQQTQKTQTQSVSTTGKQNNGTAASGNVTLTNCTSDNSDVSLPAGTGISSNGLTFITQDDVDLPFSGHRSNGRCDSSSGVSSASVAVVSQGKGAQYNISGNSSFTVAGYSSSSVTVKASNDFSGGTDNIVQVVAQADIDNATQKIAAQDSSSIKQTLEQQLKSAGLYPLGSTFTAAAPSTTNSSNVGDQATTLTVTQAVNYSMYGVKEADLKTLVDNNVKGQIDPSKQSILSEGLDKASYHVNSTTSSSVQIALATTATAGPDLNADTIKQAAAGKKTGQVQDTIKADPGVTDVQVKLSPFWVSSVPGKADRVTVTFVKAN